MKTPRIEITTKDLEVDKPSGGGKGTNVLYVVDVVIDGKQALQLSRFHFKEAGQMEAFVKIMKELTR